MNERASAKTFQDLLVWQKAHQFVLAVYRYSADFPRSEVYGLSSQLRQGCSFRTGQHFGGIPAEREG